MKLGLTGGVGCGKSAAAEIFAAAGFEVIDTDAIAREVVAPGRPAWAAVREAFGPEFFDGDGRLDRHKMAEEVFHDAGSRARLNAILHPVIRGEWTRRAEVCVASGGRALVVIPLLFETGAQGAVDRVAAVGCSASVQRARLRARGWDGAQIEARIGAQSSLENKMAASDYVLWNDGSLALLGMQVRACAAACGYRGRLSSADGV